MSDYVLWGANPLYANGEPITIASGSLAHCRRAKGEREKDGGWSGLVIAPPGKRPWFSSDPTEEKT